MIVRASGVWLSLAGGYLFLAGTVSEMEIITSLIFASLGTALACGMSRVADRHFEWPIVSRAVTRPVAALLPDTFAVGRELVAALVRPDERRGAFVRQPFDPGRKEDAGAAGRRAMVTLGLSLAPRTFMIRGEDLETMLLHALPGRAAASDREWPL